jgi:hypothetical protein
MTSPEQIQARIDATRESLSTDVDRLTEKVSPAAVVGRRVDRIKGSASSLREKVMGAMPDTGQLASPASGVQSAAGSAADAVSAAPSAVRQQAQGSPLAAGLIAFGAGMLVSALIPPSRREQDLASRAEEAAKQKAQELRGPVQEKAQQVAADLKDSAQHSAEQVKQIATDAAQATTQQAQSHAQDVKQTMQG